MEIKVENKNENFRKTGHKVENFIKKEQNLGFLEDPMIPIFMNDQCGWSRIIKNGSTHPIIQVWRTTSWHILRITDDNDSGRLGI